MSEATELDPDALQAELERIKDAMGLRERYPSQFDMWLVFGGLVLVASLGSQFVVLRDLPGYWHPVIWTVLMGAGGVFGWWRRSDEPVPSTGTKPNVLLQAAAVAAMYFVFVFGLAPALGGAGDRLVSITIFSLIIGLVGTAYIVAGESLKAYFIRRRDRYAFYVGGAWMLVLAALMPNVAVLHTWGYAVYGLLYVAYAVGAYLVLSR